MENYRCVALHELLNAMGVAKKVLDKRLFGAQVDGPRDMATQVFISVPTVYNHVILSALIQNLR